MKFLSFILFLFFTSFVHAVTGKDDRFYTENTPWEEVFNGVLKVGGCSAFVTESDVVVTAAHCFSDLLNKDGSFDEKKVKSKRVSFGNANFDIKDPSKKTHFDKRQAFYNPSGIPHDVDLKITDFYIKAGFDGGSGISNAQATTDYAFLKLNHIPKGINKFELFDPKMYKDYDLVRASNGRHVNTVGYSGDNSKTMNQKQAHLGCKAKEVSKSTHDTYINNYDCDGNPGISGGPVFYILKNKKTKKIKLAYIGTNSYGTFDGTGLDDEKRQFDPATGKYKKGIGKETGYSGSVNLSHHKDFKEELAQFKKDPSHFRDKKIQQNTQEHTRWVLENVINKKTNAELKTYLSEEQLEKNPTLRSSMFHLINLGTLPKDKEKIILEANEKYVIKKDSKETEALFNGEDSKKQLKKQKIETIFNKLKDNPNYESEIDNKHRALKEYKKMFKPCKNKESNECKKFQQSQNELKEKVCKIPEKLKKSCQKVGFEDCFKKIHTCISLNRKIQENTMADIGFIFKGKDVSGLNSERFKKTLRQCQLFNEKNFNKYLNEKKSYEDEIDQLRKKKEIAAQEVFDLKSELDFAHKAFWDKDFEMIKLFSNSFRQQQDEVKARKIGEKIRNLYSLEKDLMFDERDKKSGFFRISEKQPKSRFCQTKANNNLLKSIRQSPPKTKDLFKKNQRKWNPEIIDYYIKQSNFLCLNKGKRHLTFGGVASDQKDAIGEFEKKEKQIKEKIRNLKREIKKESFSDENLKKEFNHYESKLKELKEINPKYAEKQKEFKIKEMELKNLQDKIRATKISKKALKMNLLGDLNKIKESKDFFLDRYTIDQSRDPVKVKLKNFVKKYKCKPELPDPKNWKWNQVDFPQKGMNDESIIRPSGINKKGIR